MTWAVLVALELADVATTRLALDAGAHELNPILTPVGLGLFLALAVKAATVLAASALRSRLALALLTGYMGLVVAWNLATLAG